LIHPVFLTDEELIAQCKWSFSRSQGPGGQHRNKVETAVSIEHRPSRISAQASERRSQGENRDVALHRLRCRLAIQWIDGERSDGQSTWERYCLKGKLNVAESNADFPKLLAFLFERLRANQFDDATVAESLGTSRSQVLKFLTKFPPALQQLNQERVQRGLRPLKVDR
jgi:hypothetical protein